MLVVYLSSGYLLSMATWLAVLGGGFYGLLRRRQSRRRKGRSLVWTNAGLSVGMLLAAITAVELIFSSALDFSDTFNITNVSKRWLALHLDRERNSEGFRDKREFMKFVPKGVERIIFMGDSFTAGHGIKRMDDRFTDRIAARLDERRPGKYDVANLGEPGSEASQIESLAKALLITGVDVSIIVYVYNLNDIEGYDPRTTETIAQIYRSQPTFFLFRDTYFLNWLYFRYVQFNQPGLKSYVPHLVESYRSEPWTGLRAKLVQMNRECRQRGVQLRMVIFPFMQNLGDEYPFHDAHAKMVDFCKSEKIPVLDLEPVFRAAAGENLVVSRFDAHPNERAHAIAAEAIENGLLSDLFQPAKP